MARPKSPKKSEAVNPAAAPSEAAASTTAVKQPAPAMAAEPATVQAVAAKHEPTTPKNGDARKPEIVRKETRANLIPINLDDEIRRLAYLLSERRGFEPGHDAEDWLNAEREVLARYHQQSA